MLISFKAIDLESGVMKVDWFILQSVDESVIATDTEPIPMMTPVSYIPYTLLGSYFLEYVSCIVEWSVLLLMAGIVNILLMYGIFYFTNNYNR